VRQLIHVVFGFRPGVVGGHQQTPGEAPLQDEAQSVVIRGVAVIPVQHIRWKLWPQLAWSYGSDRREQRDVVDELRIDLHPMGTEITGLELDAVPELPLKRERPLLHVRSAGGARPHVQALLTAQRLRRAGSLARERVGQESV